MHFQNLRVTLRWGKAASYRGTSLETKAKESETPKMEVQLKDSQSTNTQEKRRSSKK